MKKNLLFLLCMFFSMAAFSQLSGVVTSKTNEPIAGALVKIKGENITATTDAAGKFSFDSEVQGTKTLVVSLMGYKTAETSVTAGSEVATITLEEEVMALNEIVVTGSANPRRKIESSVAITSLKDSRIRELAPSNVADLLKAVPGFVVENSGGEVGNNLFARGIPSAGAYEFVQIQEDGMPVFEDGALQFGNADNWLRVDDNIARMEAVRGGSGSIFATNAPGGIINFISKTGSNNFAGTAKLTAGTSGLFRTDVNFGGAFIQDKLFYNIGGFYRIDNGVRNPGFKANQGGQIKMNLKYNLDNGGYIKVYYKKLNDRNLFLLPIPLTGKDDPKGIDGFDPNYGTLTSRNFAILRAPQYDGGYYTRDLENGVHPNVDAVGAEIKANLGGGFTLNNSTRFTGIDMDYTSIVPGVEPQTAAAFAAGYMTAAKMKAPVLNPEYLDANSGSAVNPALVAKVGYWAIDKQMQNFANNLRFDYATKGLKVALGYYHSNYTSNQQWNWSNLLVSVSDNPTLLNLVDKSLNPGDINYSRTYNGIADISATTRSSQLKGDINAVYLNAEIKATDRLTFEVGARYDINSYSGYTRPQSDSQNLDNSTAFNNYDFKTTTADNSMTKVEGPYDYWDYDIKRISATGAANYKISNNMAAYVRFSHGFRGPIEEAFFSNAKKLEALKPTIINQLELGYKLQGRNFALFANAFYMSLNNVAFTDILANGTSENRFANANNIGIEVEGEYSIKGFSVNVAATLQNPIFTDFSGSIRNDAGVLVPFSNNDNTVRRIPRFYGNIRPQYKITPNLIVYVQVNYYGKKYSDNENLFTLPAFAQLDAGISLQVKKVRFAIDGTNLTNTIGLTEGNPRITGGPGDIYYARPILGRFGKLSIILDF